MRSRAQLAGENLFVRKQLALYVERRGKPRRADDAKRVVLAGLSRFLVWRQLLVVVKPGDADPQASQGIPTVLPVEIRCAWSPHDSGERRHADRDDGRGESEGGSRRESASSSC